MPVTKVSWVCHCDSTNSSPVRTDHLLYRHSTSERYSFTSQTYPNIDNCQVSDNSVGTSENGQPQESTSWLCDGIRSSARCRNGKSYNNAVRSRLEKRIALHTRDTYQQKHTSSALFSPQPPPAEPHCCFQIGGAFYAPVIESQFRSVPWPFFFVAVGGTLRTLSSPMLHRL